MKTNVMTANEMTSAPSAASRGSVAPATLFNPAWYSFNAPNGEPEGSEEATSYEEAAVQWGEHLSPGDIRLLEVWGPQGSRWFRIERELHGVVVREAAE